MDLENPPVVIITNPKDPHADAVIHFLNKMEVDVVRFHAGEAHIDSAIVVDAHGGSVRIGSSGRKFSTANLRSCWYRRPNPVDLHVASFNYPDKHLVTQETNAVLWGLYGCIDAVWYSHPYNIRQAAWKLYQLRVAAMIGFDIPRYLVSNETAAIKEFLNSYDYMVLKPIDERTTAIEIDDQPMSLYVKKFRASDLIQLTRQKPISPCYLQEYIDKAFDVRITVFGHSVFAVAIHHSANEEVVDWRVDSLELEHQVIECPPAINAMLIAYLKWMGLNFGAFDFSVDKAGHWYFLECNPNGQWLWIEIKTGLALAQTFAEHLALQRAPLIRSFSPSLGPTPDS